MRSPTEINNNNNMSKLDPQALRYLQILRLKPEPPTLNFLKKLQEAHIMRIKHENTDAFYNFPSKFNLEHLLDKYQDQGRGGVCFDLNFSFFCLLVLLRYKVNIALAQVHAYGYKKEFNTVPTHPVIIVFFKDVQYVTDVGWSKYLHPLNLTGVEYEDKTGKYRIIDCPGFPSRLQMEAYLNNEWRVQYSFDPPEPPSKAKEKEPLIPKGIYPRGFFGASAYTHVDPNHYFTNNLELVQPTKNGYKRLSGPNENGEYIFKKKENQQSTSIILTMGVNNRQDIHYKAPHELASNYTKLTRPVSTGTIGKDACKLMTQKFQKKTLSELEEEYNKKFEPKASTQSLTVEEVLHTEFNISVDIASRCAKPTRSMSAPGSYAFTSRTKAECNQDSDSNSTPNPIRRGFSN